jgi:hypothetical protein
MSPDAIRLWLTPMIRPPIEQYGTDTGGAELSFEWPEGIPGPDNLLVGFLAVRSNVIPADVVPCSYSSYGGFQPLPNPGTEWNVVDNINCYPASPAGGIAMACRDSDGTETAYLRWVDPVTGNGIGGGTARPRGHHAEIAGLSGMPTVVESGDDSTAGYTYESVPITVPGAGYIFWGWAHHSSSPGDRVDWTLTTVAAVAPAHILTAGFADGDFSPTSIFGYRYVSAAGTYTVTLERTGFDHYNSEPFGFILAFWPGPESATYPA